MGLLTASAVLPCELVNPKSATAKEVKKVILGEVEYTKPAIMPKVIWIFLYGGPSELAGNLTNIEEINVNSQNKYPANLLPATPNNLITPNFFLKTAGGTVMENLIASQDLSIYRTINRIKEDNKAHELSVLQNLVGNKTMDGPGIATTLAAVMAANNAFNKNVDNLLLPFVSFEGDSVIFQRGDLNLPPELKATSLDSGFRNPYERPNNSFVGTQTQDSLIEALSRKISSAIVTEKKMNEAFDKRAVLDSFIKTNFTKDIVNSRLPAGIVYPNTNFGNRLKAAMAIAIDSADTLFISVGGAGLGGWDDHSSSLTPYTTRMEELMQAMNIAVSHMKVLGRNDIIINIFGDFGRNVNLNNSMGWDHGNNQNLYTLGGSAIRPGALGKIVGKTKRIGTPFENRQFTSPTADSYQCEPFSIASSIYKYFGIKNPPILTGEPAIDEINPVNQKV
jgi:hypothetical protein